MKFCVFPRGKEKADIYKKKTQNADACVGLRFGRVRSSINVVYFFLFRNYKIFPMKKRTIILFVIKLRQILHTFSFCSITMRAVVN